MTGDFVAALQMQIWVQIPSDGFNCGKSCKSKTFSSPSSAHNRAQSFRLIMFDAMMLVLTMMTGQWSVCVCGVLVFRLTVRWRHSCPCSLGRSAPGPQRAGGGTFERDGVLERLAMVRAGVRFHRATGSFCCRSEWWSPNVVKRGMHSAYCSFID